jgi:nucleotide-binding universal stress UspA family protein
MYHKILVPLDGSALAEAALEHLRHVAGSESEVLLLRVMEVVAEPVPVPASAGLAPIPPVIAPSLGTAEATAAARTKAFSDAEEYLESKANALRGSVRAVRTLVLGDADVASAIAGVAESEQVDLIVMSTHGRTGVVRWLLGSIAEKVVRSTHAPILLVRPGRPTE